MAKKDKPPDRIGRYEIRRELGRGVMGVVYQAWDTMLGRTIALKTIKPVADSAEQREAWERRFLVEARAAARLSHPAIVVVYDVGRDPETDVLYIALEYLEGQSLAQKSGPGRPLPWREALRIVRQVAEGLHHAHTQGVVHRDVKPANVMVVASGDAKVLDFGVARLDDGTLTNPGDLCGTPLYMSPEQASGHALDARSDIFSLGAVAWTLLTGQSPFEAPSVSAILMRVMHKAPAPPSEIVAGVPKAVDEILARALAKMPEDRYPDARQLAEDVEDALADRVPRHRAEWNPATTGERTRVSADGGGTQLPALQLRDSDAPPASLRRRRRLWPGVALLLGLGAAAAVHLRAHPEDRSFWAAQARLLQASRPAQTLVSWLRRGPGREAATAGAATAWPETAPPPASAATPDALAAHAGSEVTLGASPDETAVPTDPDGEDTTSAAEPELGEAEPEIEEPPAAESPSDAGTSAPEPSVGPSASEPPPPSATPSATTAAVPPVRPTRSHAYLSVGFEHRLKSGTLEVWVDGRRVAREKLDSRTTKKVLLLEVRKGSVERTLRLAPGRHRVSVRVRSGGTTKTAGSSALFRRGTTRRLEISLSRLSGKVSLEWR